MGKETSLALGHSCRVQLLSSSRTGGGQYTPTFSSVLMPGPIIELEGALRHNLSILAVAQGSIRLTKAS